MEKLLNALRKNARAVVTYTLAILVFLGLISVVTSCVSALTQAAERNKKTQEARWKGHLAWWNGQHELQRMLPAKDNLGCSFFLFSGKTNSQMEVWFAWKTCEGYYAINHLPLDKFRVKFDEKAATPTIEFEVNSMKPLDTCNYVLISCQSKDWTPHLTLPLNSQPILPEKE